MWTPLPCASAAINRFIACRLRVYPILMPRCCLTPGWLKLTIYYWSAALPRVPPQLFDKVAPAGVDFVLGNPPYVRVESIPEPQNTRYRQLFPTMRGRADLYVGFYEAALRQLNPGGICAFICADCWMMNQYGETLRRYISESFAVETLLEMYQTAAFEEEVTDVTHRLRLGFTKTLSLLQKRPFSGSAPN